MRRFDLRRVESRLHSFVTFCFEGMGRSERRQALGRYVRGLLIDGERKSIEPIAERLAQNPSEVQAIRQRLQQAVTVATWDEATVYQRIATRFVQAVKNIGALVVDDTGFPKKGWRSVGVQRQYSGTMGRVDNCQIATSLHLASEEGGACIGMRLYLPDQWVSDPKKRKKTGIPETIEFKEKWRIALDLIDHALAWKLGSYPVVADAGYGDATEFREGLRLRQLTYVVGVSSSPVVWPPGTCPRPPPRRRPRQMGRPRTKWSDPKRVAPLSVRDLAESLPRSAFRRVTWRIGSRGKQSSYFTALRIRTAHRHAAGAPPGEEEWLICEWPERAEKPTTFYLSNLPANTSLKRLVYLAKLRWRIERDYQEMKGELGLDHFEGRGWVGFHHHAACVAAAHAFLTIDRVLFPPHHNQTDVPSVSSPTSNRSAEDARLLPSMSPGD